MASLLIRRLDDAVKQRLRLRAAEHGCSMEEEAREILTSALQDPKAQGAARWFERLHQEFASIGGLPDPPPRAIEPHCDPFEE